MVLVLVKWLRRFKISTKTQTNVLIDGWIDKMVLFAKVVVLSWLPECCLPYVSVFVGLYVLQGSRV